MSVKNGHKVVVRIERDHNLDTLEGKMMSLLADSLNGLGYVHRKKMKRKAGHWYRAEVTFQWPKDGILEVELFEMMEAKAP